MKGAVPGGRTVLETPAWEDGRDSALEIPSVSTDSTKDREIDR